MAELVIVPGQIRAWSTLRRARDANIGGSEGQADRINVQMARLLYAFTMLGAPPLLWMIVMRDEIVSGVLGPEWAACAQLVAILAFGRLLLFVGITTEPLMSLSGQARRMPAFMAAIFALSVGLTLLAAPFGLLALAWAQVAVSAFSFVATLWLFARHAAIQWSVVARPLVSTLIPLSCGVLSIVVLNATVSGGLLPDLVEAVAFGLAGGVVFGGLALFLNPDLRIGLARMYGGL
jgi:O-antigen/teichoic acid export membrane protein